MAKVVKLTLWIEVHDEAKLQEAAKPYIEANGLDADDWAEVIEHGDPSAQALREILTFPAGKSPSQFGCEIIDAEVEERESLHGYRTPRDDLVQEYVNHRESEGDWDDEEEAMTPAQRRTHFRACAERLTHEQLMSACKSYAIAADS